MLQITNIPPILAVGVLIIFVNIILGAVVYLNNKKSATNIIFALLNLVTVLYISSNLLGAYIPDLSTKLFWVRMVMFFAIFQTYFFYLLARAFPNNKIDINFPDAIFSAGVAILTGVLTLTPFVFSGITGVGVDGVPSLQAERGMIVFGIVVFYFVAYGLYQLIVKYKRAKGIEKSQLGYLLTGAAIMFSSFLIFNFVLVVLLNITVSINFTSVFVSIFIIFTSYAILRYGLLHIKVIATELFVFSLWIFILVRALLANNRVELVSNIALFILTVVVGIFLIRSVQKEVAQREKIEQLAADLEKANERLKELDQLKSEFVSLATHQIRGPLAVIKGYASLMLEGDYGEVPKNLSEPIDTIYKSSQSLAVIVEDFLDVSRIEQGGMKYDFTDFDFAGLVKEVAGELKPNIEKNGLAISVSGCDAPVTVSGDRGKLKQVVGNLLDNSIKYTSKGSIAVSLSVDASAGKVLLTIKDTGAGIRPETIPHLFKKFSRAEDASKNNILGTGLGLYVAKEMLKAHGGKIWAESEGEGKGSTFFVELKTV